MRPIKALFLFLSLLLALGLVEGALRGVYSIYIDYDIEMWRYAKLLKIPTADERGHRHRPNAQVKLMGVDVRTNEYGWRGPNVNNERKISPSIMVLGDSLTFGWGVKEEKTFASKLGENNIEIFNLGIGNTNTKQQFATLKKTVKEVVPDQLIWAFYINDPEEMQSQGKLSWYQHTFIYAFLKKHWLHFRPYWNSYYEYHNYYNRIYSGERWNTYKELVAEIKEWSRRNGMPINVVLLPEVRTQNTFVDKLYQKVEELYRNEGFSVLNLHHRLKDMRGLDYWVANDDPHPNELAHAKIASEIYLFLKKGDFRE